MSYTQSVGCMPAAAAAGSLWALQRPGPHQEAENLHLHLNMIPRRLKAQEELTLLAVFTS